MTIQNKLLFTLLALSIFIIGSLAMYAQWSFSQGLINYVNSKEQERLEPFLLELKTSYEQNGSWKQWQGKERTFFNRVIFYLEGDIRSGMPTSNRALSAQPPPPPGKRPPPPERRAPSFALIDAQNQQVIGRLSPNAEYRYLPIFSANEQIGSLAIPNKETLSQDYEFEIVAQQQQYLLLVGLFLFSVVVLVSLLFARHFVKPIKAVVAGMTELTRGNYQQFIGTQRKDELGTLSEHFNTLAERLTATESNRKRWLATVSHELRTPVAILKGETEALLDGVREPTTQNLESIHSEINQLSILIDDLYALTSQQLDDIHVDLQHLDLLMFLRNNEQKYSQFLASKNIEFITHYPKGKLELLMDPVRVNQLFENLFTNCVKYANASRVELRVEKRQEIIHVSLEDNGVGVDAKHFSHIFEYLYRVDEHRKRSDGGVGLGLALCAQIVHRHSGNIYAASSSIGGLAICIDLPINKFQATQN